MLRSGTRLPRNGRSAKSTPGSTSFALEGLFDAVQAIASENAQREYYLPDLVAIYRRLGRGVETMTVANPNEIRGINSRAELAEVSRIVRQQKNNELMAAGVTIEDPATTYIDVAVTIAADTIVHPGVSLEGRTTIGAGCEIHSGVRIVDSHDRRPGDDPEPLRDHGRDDRQRRQRSGRSRTCAPERDVRDGAQVGNFVELKKTVLGRGSKAMHLSYLGDATIGENVNIGAGTITCNYDGVTKQPTMIEDGAFIGSDSQLIAPVTVSKGAYVGSGTTVREDVPAGALAVSAGNSAQHRRLGGEKGKARSKK